MNRRDREYQDLMILETIGGEGNSTLSIEDGYFRRERDENLKEQGYPLNPVPELTGSDIERRIFKSYYDMEEAEEERTNPTASNNITRRREGQIDKGWPEREAQATWKQKFFIRKMMEKRKIFTGKELEEYLLDDLTVEEAIEWINNLIKPICIKI
jgi:cobalamin biosynthesis Mg chelatase CobN